VISFRRPRPKVIEEYGDARLQLPPTAVPGDARPAGFRHESFATVVGSGAEAFERARLGLQQWAAHRGSGIEVFPTHAAIAQGTTVVLVTRQLALWVVAACRIEAVIDEPTTFGFTYATLPGHPECGYESFTVRWLADEVRFEIEATSRHSAPIIRMGAPLVRLLQRRATDAYLTALQRWTQRSG
jgi:uncharacterized protein (UPF0548 family)